jgi:rubrerythrin
MSDNRVQRLLNVLRDAMELERRGHAFYLQAAESTTAPRGKSTFLTLARDELDHLNLLDEAFRSLLRDGTMPRMPEPSDAAPSAPPKRPTVFPSPKEAAQEIRVTAGEVDALKRGMEAEQDSIALYSQELARAETEDEKQLFGSLVAVEQGHLTILQGEYDYVNHTGFWMGYQEFSMESFG